MVTLDGDEDAVGELYVDIPRNDVQYIAIREGQRVEIHRDADLNNMHEAHVQRVQQQRRLRDEHDARIRAEARADQQDADQRAAQGEQQQLIAEGRRLLDERQRRIDALERELQDARRHGDARAMGAELRDEALARLIQRIAPEGDEDKSDDEVYAVMADVKTWHRELTSAADVDSFILKLKDFCDYRGRRLGTALETEQFEALSDFVRLVAPREGWQLDPATTKLGARLLRTTRIACARLPDEKVRETVGGIDYKNDPLGKALQKFARTNKEVKHNKFVRGVCFKCMTKHDPPYKTCTRQRQGEGEGGAQAPNKQAKKA
jgi:hypothetical protein